MIRDLILKEGGFQMYYFSLQTTAKRLGIFIVARAGVEPAVHLIPILYLQFYANFRLRLPFRHLAFFIID
ncbi:hypothetical protein SPHINGO8BC_51483 [Sphingobacterium multivorum]|uniref:Uncharacterized protein n=1 Tax=Sphingobacterium multivorum TaxID=28454 RepID=A0A654D1J3_SPHMU|nr:hypothetical protein SPHINGO8BC_51483 [Sphingobacterium multivorum]